MATVDDPDMEMDSEEELEEEVDGSGESRMEVEEENRIRWVPVARPVDRPYGRPRLDELPPTVLYRIVRHMIGDIGATLAFRMTCKALKKIVAETPDLWWKHAQYLRGRTQMLFAPDPVVLPGHLVPAFQEELLRCAFILHYKWTNPAFRALSVNRKAGSQWSPHGVEQILFVPDSAGRYFLTVSRVDVHLWTLEPNSLPRMCRRIFPRANALLGEKESIVNALVSRPQGPIPGSPKSMVSYLAIQYTLKDSSRLRTEIYQLHLSPPGADLGPGFGLCGIHMTEGSLVAFTDFVLAYALGDAAQTILLCCWVTRQATRLVTPVREWEVRWQHQSCRAVTIGLDIIIVVRDSTAEVYPRAGFTLLEESEWPRRILYTPIEGDLEYLPTIYATDIAVFPCNFTKTPKIHIHQPRAAASVSEGVAIELCVQPISLIGVARSSVPLSEPHVPYYVETAKLFKTYTPWPTPYMSGAPTPSVSATPSPSHTAPPSPSHTASYPVTMPLPEPERYKFVFHVHALQPQHPRWDYGPILAGPNGRGVILASNIGVGPGPRQFLAKFRHPSNEELRMMVWPDANIVMNPVPRPFRVPQANGANGPPQPTASAPIPVQQVPPTIPPQMPPQIPPAMHPPPHGMGPMIHPPPPPDPFAPLMALMRPVAPLDILQKMSFLWTTNDTFRYELLAWDEGGGTLILGTKRGDLEIIECAFPPPPPLPRAHTGRAHP